MSFGSFLSGIYHQINPFDNGQSYGTVNPKKKKRDDNPAPRQAPAPIFRSNQPQNTSTPQVKRPENLFDSLSSALNSSQNNNAPNQVNPQSNSPTSSVLAPKPGAIIKPLPQPVVKKPQTSLFGDIVQGVKSAPGAFAGTALGVGRAAEGAVSAIPELGNQLTHAVNFLPRKLAGDDSGVNRFLSQANRDSDSMTDTINRPINWLAKKTDEAALGYGPTSESFYRPAQVAANVVTAVPGSIEGGARLATKLPAIRALGGGETSNVTNLLRGWLDSQRYSPTIGSLGDRLGIDLSKVPFIRRIIEPAPSAPNPANVFDDINGDAITKSVDDFINKPTPVPVRQGIDVNAPPTEPTPIPVQNRTPQGPIIREIGGDAPNVTRVPTPDDVLTQRATNSFDNRPTGLPDPTVEGFKPTNATNPNIVTVQQVQDERKALDDALANGEINKTQHKVANKALDQTPTTDVNPERSPNGKKIEVKQVNPVPVVDNTTKVPQGLPEKPGTVRVTTKSEPQVAKTEAAAAQPAVVSPEVKLSQETQAVLDNPKQFNKRQVAAAKNQLKLARQYRNNQEKLSQVIEETDNIAPSSDKGFVKTGKFKKGARGNTYEEMNLKAESQKGARDTATKSPDEVIQKATANKANHGGYSIEDQRNVKALIDSKRLKTGTPEYEKVNIIRKEIGTQLGQQMRGQRGITLRRTASADQLVSNFAGRIYGMAKDPEKINSKLFDKVDESITKFTKARDEAKEAYETYIKSKSSKDYKAYQDAYKAANKADIASKQTELSVAREVLKGNKDVQQMRKLEKMANEAGGGTMDYVDANMLSGTGTSIRNLVNSVPNLIEEGIFGKPAAAIANKAKFITKAADDSKIGGGLGRGTLRDIKESSSEFGDRAKFLKREAGNVIRHPIKNLRAYSTITNEAGDIAIDTAAKQSMKNHYVQVLRDEGHSGKQLDELSTAMAQQDPDGVRAAYEGAARAQAGLGGGNIVQRGKLEQNLSNILSTNVLGLGRPSARTDAIAKAVVRGALGFPTAVGRSTSKGIDKFALGVPNIARALRVTEGGADGLTAAAAAEKRALLVKQAVKDAGTGIEIIPPLFYALGKAGLISGEYPSDNDERAQWTRDGKSENAIKIGGAWYQLPAYLGTWSVPATFWANMGATGNDFKKSLVTTAKGVADVIPDTAISGYSDAMKQGGKTAAKFESTAASGLVRSLTPAGALLNQLAKSFDSTKNDTNTGEFLSSFVNKVASGIPGHQKVIDIPDKLDDQGNVIRNPNAVENVFGASSAVQPKGVEASKNITANVNKQLTQIDKYGALTDPNLQKILEGKSLDAYNKAKNNQQLDPSDIKSLQKGLVKGVTSSSDTAYLEKGQYDTNLSALRLKKQLMSEDPTTKPSDLEKIDTSIKRGKVYKDNKIPYNMIERYENGDKGISVSEWRAMGDPDSDSYDPDMYQKLWDIDQKMTKAGVSYKKGDPTKQKYYEKKKSGGSGRGGGRGRASSLSTDFGKITSSPKVQAYQTIDQQSGSVPVIQVQRPNIVHKIGVSG